MVLVETVDNLDLFHTPHFDDINPGGMANKAIDCVPPPISFDDYRTNNHHEIVEEDEDDHTIMPSIMEEEDLFSIDTNRNLNDVVYVVTWRGSDELLSASMDALVWTIGSVVHGSSSIVYLVHVFPELKFIPTPRKYTINSHLIYVNFCFLFSIVST